MYGIFIDIDQCRSLVYITFYLLVDNPGILLSWSGLINQ